MAATSPAGLALATSSGRWRLAPHLDLIDKLIVDAVAGRAPSRLIIEVPPRHGKSELISRHTPAWFLGCFPDKRVLLATYGGDFAASWGRKNRDLLEEHGRGLYGIAVDQSSRASDRWDIADHEGGMGTAGVGGGITGKGADLFIIDDPVKDAEEAQSDIIRQRHWDWWQSTASTRLHPGAVVILLMTRWHEDDLAGRLLTHFDEDEDAEGEEWVEVRLPALAEPGDPLGRALDEALWPARFSAAWLRRKRHEIGDYWFNALYQGRPTALEGAILKLAYWSYYDPALLEALALGGHWSGPTFKRIWQSWDTSLKEKTTSDFAVGQLWGQDLGERYLLRQTRARMGLGDTIQAVRDLTAWAIQHFGRLGHHSVFMENAANGPEVMAVLRRELGTIIPVNQDRDKVSRAWSIEPLLRGGSVFVPGDRTMSPNGWRPDTVRTPSWVQGLQHECAAFPHGTNDDQVDSLTQALDPKRFQGDGSRKPRDDARRPVTAGLSARDV